MSAHVPKTGGAVVRELQVEKVANIACLAKGKDDQIVADALQALTPFHVKVRVFQDAATLNREGGFDFVLTSDKEQQVTSVDASNVFCLETGKDVLSLKGIQDRIAGFQQALAQTAGTESRPEQPCGPRVLVLSVISTQPSTASVIRYIETSLPFQWLEHISCNSRAELWQELQQASEGKGRLGGFNTFIVEELSPEDTPLKNFVEASNREQEILTFAKGHQESLHSRALQPEALCQIFVGKLRNANHKMVVSIPFQGDKDKYLKAAWDVLKLR